VHDVNPARLEPLVAAGATVENSAEAVAADCHRTICMVETTAQADAVILGENGIAQSAKQGDIVLCMSTIDPLVARRMADALAKKGVAMLDAPVSGRPPTMTVMVGGEAPVFEKYRPLLAAMAGNIFHVGESGAGCVAKLVTQYLGYTNFVAALEGMLIGAKAGIDLAQLARIVPLSAGASRTFDNIPRSVLTGAFTAGGTLDIVAKDLALACDLAREVMAPAQLGLLAHDVLHRAQAQGWGQEGFPVAAKILEAMAGVELRAPSLDTLDYQAQDPRRRPQRT